MKKSERLKLIIDLQTRKEQDALAAFGRNQQKLLELQGQLQNLQTYRSTFDVDFENRQRQGMNINQLLEYRAFADKLEKAIDGQKISISTQEQELLRSRKLWEESHHRTKSLQKISDLAVLEELKLENRREQNEQDARAARSFRKDGA